MQTFYQAHKYQELRKPSSSKVPSQGGIPKEPVYTLRSKCEFCGEIFKFKLLKSQEWFKEAVKEKSHFWLSLNLPEEHKVRTELLKFKPKKLVKKEQIEEEKKVIPKIKGKDYETAFKNNKSPRKLLASFKDPRIEIKGKFIILLWRCY